jgi:hypothetical protein
MRQIKDVLADSASQNKSRVDEKIYLDPLCSHLVDQIFIKMALICRGFDAFYADRNRLNAEKMQWTLAFTKLGIRTKLQIMPALNRLELYKFPNPPQMGEFLEWRFATPQEIGLPEVGEAYRISLLINQQFSQYYCECKKTLTVIKHAINQIGSLEYREMKSDKSRKLFESNYLIACRQFMEGELKEISKALCEKPEEHPSDKKRSDDSRIKAMDAIRSMGIEISQRMPNNPI